jgi:uncharacterized protein (TIGR02145 family)
MKYLLYIILFLFFKGFSQPVMNIHLNNGKVIRKFIGAPGLGMPYFNVHIGNLIYLNNNLNYGSLTDQNGNFYKTISIGSQVWMAENLRATSFSNGDLIANHTDRIDSLIFNDIPFSVGPGWFKNYNDTLLNFPYGNLYTPMTIIDQRNICPVGWHVPTVTDWYILFSNFGGINSAADDLSSNNYQFWHDYSTPSSNSSGFSLLPHGPPSSLGNGAHTFVYTSNLGTGVDSQKIYFYWINSNTINLSQESIYTPNDIFFGGIIRCIKN